MKEAGYDSETIDKVKKMVGKQGLKTDPDVQLIEDIACLVFIESAFLDFAEGYDEAKLVSLPGKPGKKCPRVLGGLCWNWIFPMPPKVSWQKPWHRHVPPCALSYAGLKTTGCRLSQRLFSPRPIE
ncbi:MAG: DUF4202 family protein [Pseudomonadota bacterium]